MQRNINPSAVSPTAPAGDVVLVLSDAEAQVLPRTVRWHPQSRLLHNGGRTVVFR